MVAVGTVLQDRYRIVQNLGGGGMGQVYLAHDVRLADKPCAVKQMIPDPHLSPEERAQDTEQFRKEAAVLAHLSHHHLPDVSDYFEDEESFFLVMEYIEGQTLGEKLAEAPEGLPQVEVVDWGVQLCDVLTYLHEQDPPVIFRDLKPSNVMVTGDAGIRLIDFGVIRLFDPDKKTDTLKMGTAGYAPPEQYAGQGQTTPRSDIYALGVTLHELLTSDDPTAHPFVFSPPNTLRRGLSASLSNAILRAVSLDPEDRFPTAAAFKRALEKATQPRRFTLPLGLGKRNDKTAVLSATEVPAPAAAKPSWIVRLLRGTARLLGSIALALLIAAIILVVVVSFGLSFFAERAIAGTPWYLGPDLQMRYTIEEDELADDVWRAIEPYMLDAVQDVWVRFESSDQVIISAQFGERTMVLRTYAGAEEGLPDIMLEELNDVPLYGVGGIVSSGIRRGFEKGLAGSGVRVLDIGVRYGVLHVELGR